MNLNWNAMRVFARRLTLVCYFLLFFTGASHASVVYTYTGSHFESLGQNTLPTHPGKVFEESDGLFFQIRLSSVLPAGTTFGHTDYYLYGSSTSLSNADGGSNPLPPAPAVESWFLSIGAVTLSGVGSQNLIFSMTHDLNGDVSRWQILANETSNYSRPFSDSLMVDTNVFSVGVTPGAFIEYVSTCLGDISCLDSGNYSGASTQAAGIWTVAAVDSLQVPTPSSASLLMAALSGVAFLRRRAK
jgi:hypothetical protein